MIMIKTCLLITIVIFLLLLSSCTFFKQITGDVECPPGECCLDLTERMKILNTLKPVKGWYVRGCYHSKQKDCHTPEEVMYCEFCDGKSNRMWAEYYYDTTEWKLKNDEPADHCRKKI